LDILVVGKYPPIQGGVSASTYWLCQLWAEMGHRVAVVSNAQEVEPEYRQIISENDISNLYGFRKQNAVDILYTGIDPSHFFIPRGNPVVTKLIAAGLTRITHSRPNFIFAFYFEPYALCAWALSKMTGVPFVLRHAGSDLGRLMKSTALAETYRRILIDASAIATSEGHFNYFKELGVRPERLLRAAEQRLPGDVFYPTPMPPADALRLGSYGKVGRAKGTFQLLDTLGALREKKVCYSFTAHWGGQQLQLIHSIIEEKQFTSTEVKLLPLLPPWRVPEFIRSCHIIFFLESGFSIEHHTPSVPLEVLACGRYLVVTREIAVKSQYQDYLLPDRNCSIVDELSTDSICSAITSASAAIRNGGQIECSFDASIRSVADHQAVERLLAEIGSLI
jgi:glycosyltransferase involved in cell wall biosynthesis